MFGNLKLDGKENNWRHQLNKFVKANQRELAALSWGFSLIKGDIQDTLGIDIKPTPHFIACPKADLEKLNQNVNDHIQEILGVIDGHQADKEVVIIGIGNSQIKLIQFQSEPPPPICYQEIAAEFDALVQLLEQRMLEQMQE